MAVAGQSSRSTRRSFATGDVMAGAPYRTLSALDRAIVRCRRCPRLRRHCLAVSRTKVARFRDQTYWGKPVTGFGDPAARLLVVGLAPAAHGGNRTGRIFTGDSSGDWLYQALHRFGFANQPVSRGRNDGLRLSDCWITAVARCAPPGNRPLPAELARCRPFLEAELHLLRRVRVVVTLGAIAHRGFLVASGRWEGPAGLRPPFRHGGLTALPDGTTLISSYHPSRQNTNTGRLTRAMWHRVFREARQRVDAAG